MSANETLFSFPHYKFIHLIIHSLGSYVIYVYVCIFFFSLFNCPVDHFIQIQL